MLLKDKKVLITGATGGIGRAICELFLQNGAELFITNIQEQSLVEHQKELLKNFPKARINYYTCDLANKTAIKQLVEVANKTMNGIDILIGNAGITIDTLTLRMSDEQWQKVLDINLSANFILSRECVKIMSKQHQDCLRKAVKRWRPIISRRSTWLLIC